MYILGISAFYHDAAACLLKDGEIVAAAQEERFTRKKHDPSFPTEAIAYCLGEAGITHADLEIVGFYEKPLTKFDRLIETFLGVAPRGLRPYLKAMPIWLSERLHLRRRLRKKLPGFKGRLLFTEHHESHAASAFFPSPFESAAVLTMDGVGEWTTASYGRGNGNELELLGRIPFPHSLGMLYSAFTHYTGFRVNSGEYKVMGLAPYGEPKFADRIREKLVRIHDDGSFHLDMNYFAYHKGLTMTNRRFHDLFGGPPRSPESEITQKEMDLAASIQEVIEEVVLKIARTVQAETGEENLCMAGGVALNCVANGRLLREGPFKRIWIQPAAGDAGGSLGCALALWHRYCDGPRTRHEQSTDDQKGSYLGPAYPDGAVSEFVKEVGAKSRLATSDDELVASAVEALRAGKVIGWFQGRMEFGPRALGNRSILGDPRSKEMQRIMNLKIKFRESFRPFAPSVQREHLTEYFEIDADSPYMLLVADVQKSRRRKMTDEENALFGIEKLNIPRSDLPAITHVDYSARVQTVHKETNPLYWKLLEAFRQATGCAVLVNTSFNVRGEPIVCTPKDAYTCFMRTEIDRLIVGRHIFDKADQPPLNEEVDWKLTYALD